MMLISRPLTCIPKSISYQHNISLKLLANIITRNMFSMEVTPNITLLTQEKQHVKNLKGGTNDQESKPLVIILPWLLAKKSHIFKYADFYIQKGFDVVNVTITPWQMLWPVKGTQVVAKDVVEFLDNNNLNSPLIIHGFSVGGYLWSEVLVRFAADQNRYQHILDRFVGQIWDSLADITEIPDGFPYAVFPNNQMLQRALRQYIIYHLKTFDEAATRHYVRGSKMFYANIIKAPALFFVSKSDPIGSETSNLKVKESWENAGIKVHWKCWEKSPHVGHFRHYPDQYIAELTTFLRNIDLGGSKEEHVNTFNAKL